MIIRLIFFLSLKWYDMKEGIVLSDQNLPHTWHIIGTYQLLLSEWNFWSYIEEIHINRLKYSSIFLYKNEEWLKVFKQGSLSGERCIVRQTETNMEDGRRQKRDDPENRKGRE